jgi:hypothetical protein
METTTATTLEKFNAYLFLTVCGYCMGRQLIAFYYAYIELKKIRRQTDNAFMNLLVSHEEAMAYEDSMA